MRVLVGDIGGTKTELALAISGVGSDVGGGIEISAVRRYASVQAASLAAIVRAWIDETGIACDVAAFAVAGPVAGDRCKTTNLPWELDARALAQELGLANVQLLNDLEAIAWGVASLRADQLATLHEAPSVPGNACVIAVGTGLGVAGLAWDGGKHRPFASEGGHLEFAATDEREFALVRRLRARHGRASWERVVSGPGIVALFECVLDWRGARAPEWFELAEDRAAAIGHAAEHGICELAIETMDWFARSYARVIGDLALAHLAVGGVYLAGGVTLRNRWLLEREGWLDGVFAKGRMRAVVERAPIRVIVAEDVALIGAHIGYAARA